MTLQKLLLHIFHVTTLSFSDITLIVIPSASKMVGGVTYILFTAMTYSSTGKSNIYHCNQNYGLFFFFGGEASKFLSSTYALTNLTPKTTTPSAPYLSFNRMQLRSHYIIFYFSSISVRYNRRG